MPISESRRGVTQLQPLNEAKKRNDRQELPRVGHKIGHNRQMPTGLCFTMMRKNL